MPDTPLSFPLQPIDAHGRVLSIGSNVRVLSVESCVSELPPEDQERLRRVVGQSRRIIEFDRSGFAWLSFSAEPSAGSDLCLFPKEVALV